MSGFHGAFATGLASQQGTLTLPDTWFRPPFWDLLMLQLLRPNSRTCHVFTRLFTSNTPWYFLDFTQQYEVSLTNDKWHSDPWPTVTSNQSDFPPISWPWYRLWPSPIYEWSICNGCGMPAGNAYPSGHLVPSPILGLANAPIVETKFLELAMSLLDFSPRIPLGTFSSLLFSAVRHRVDN